MRRRPPGSKRTDTLVPYTTLCRSVDKGVQALPGSDGEKITEGLDGLPKRMAEYHQLGARFAKWRAVLTIDAATGKPSRQCLVANAEADRKSTRLNSSH